MCEELSYWSDLDETVIGVVFRDTTDNDFGWIAMLRDRIGRFRCVDVNSSIATELPAEAALRIRIAEISRTEDLRKLGGQGDEPNEPFDLLNIPPETKRDELHPYFIELVDRPGKAPARAVIREIAPWLAPADPHFVQEFQRHQFDQRLWEMFLWAAFRDLGFGVGHHESPDFKCLGPGIAFTVEATTVAPSTMGPLAVHPDPETSESQVEFLAGYMPIKFASSLTSKLSKVDKDGRHYWEKELAEGMPFILAVADFHKPAEKGAPGSMVYTQSALWTYLYGHRADWNRKTDGTLVIKPTPIEAHQYGDKRIESGFFDLPLAENISAVLFSNAGTIAKFDRIGVVAGFAAPKHKYFRVGLKYDPDPKAVVGKPFSIEVAEGSYSENWFDEIQLFHNPNAARPIPVDWFPGVTHWLFDGDEFHVIAPEDRILSSYTLNMSLRDE